MKSRQKVRLESQITNRLRDKTIWVRERERKIDRERERERERETDREKSLEMKQRYRM